MSSDKFINVSNIEEYRLPWESGVEWKLRRHFLCNHSDRIPESRLICLSQVFANVEFFGCSYPVKVMEEVEALSEGIVEDYRQRKKEEHRINFVKAQEEKQKKKKDGEALACKYKGFIRSSDSVKDSSNKTDNVPTELKVFEPLNSTISSAAGSASTSQNQIKRTPSVVVSQPQQNFQNTGNFKVPQQYTTPEHQDSTPFEKRLKILGNLLRNRQQREPNILQLMDVCLNKLCLKFTCDIEELLESATDRSPVFTCSLFCNDVLISYARGMNKKNSRINAYRTAFDKLTKPHIKIAMSVTGREELVSAITPITEAFANNVVSLREKNTRKRKIFLDSQQPEFKRKKTIDDFVILERVVSSAVNPISVMQESANFTKIELKYEFDTIEDKGTTVNRCSLFIEGELAAQACDATKLRAKYNVAALALERLKGLRPTIRITKDIDDNAAEVSRDEVIGEPERKDEFIADSNIGNQLLRKMGWSGGGIGKAGNEGIEEPIKVNNVFGRAGLGLSNSHVVTHEFLTVMEGVVKDYARRTDEEDLVFSPEFHKEERAAIHKIATRYHLKSVSRGKGLDRFLVLSRKRTPQQLLRHLQESGGATNKFELVGPNFMY